MTRRDGEDDDERAPRRQRNLATELRDRLRDVGIELDDEPKPKRSPPPRIVPAVDRDAIRAVLEPLGVPEWMIASCPSLDLAQSYATRVRLADHQAAPPTDDQENTQ